MKIHPVPVIIALLLLSLFANSQDERQFSLSLKSGSFVPEKNITAEKINAIDQRSVKSQGRSFLVIQFEKIPSETEKKQLLQAGIALLEYIPRNAYTATVTGSLNSTLLQQVKARAVVELTPEQKMQPALAKGVYPSWAVKVGGTVDVWISFPKTFSFESVSSELRTGNIDITGTTYKDYRIVELRISSARLKELAALPFIEYVQARPAEDKTLNYNSTTNSRASILGSTITGGRNLKGQGIVIGVGDNTDPQTHIDFTGRLIPRAPLPYVNGGSNHGTHVTGTASGAGISNEFYTGAAPKARVISQAFSGIIANAAAYVTDDSMVVTNNSYGNGGTDCNEFGNYDLYSRVVDLQAFELPKLQHVFAAGNSGGFTCAPYAAGFHTVLGGYQSSKNVINVGNTFATSSIYPSSSRGPVDDGRIKPEICAQGEAVISSIGATPNNYGAAWGTSMASPAVAGGSALLYQRYKQLNSNVNPKSGLIKALVCNGGTDLGNPGPDYTYGFGWLNLLRSVDMLENNRYIISSVANGGDNTHNITVPANTAQLKVMLYWHDPAAAVLAVQTLVNDLDLEVTDPSSNTSLPYILDTVPANINNAATTGADHINNIEQVVISNPATGSYTLRVQGTAVTENPSQEYFLVYDFVPVQTIITHPAGGEKFTPGQTINLQWDSYGDPANTFTLEYSTDNGSNWTTINNNVAANLRRLAWTVPSVNTEQALVRITRNSTALVSTSQAFTIVGIPAVSLAGTQCEGYIALQWGAVTGATDYEVMMLRGDDMVSMGTTAGTTYTISGLSRDSVYWVAVRSRVNGIPGRRSGAISRQPNSGTCAGTISDNDLKVDAILAPQSGRLLTSSALTATTTISARIKNLDDAAINTFNVKYSVNGGAFVSEAGAGPIAAGGTYTHNFAATYDFSGVNNYSLRIVVENTSAADPVGINDTVTVLVKQLPNAPITLITGSDFTDDLETADDSAYYRGQIGLSGADRYDFNSSTALGRVRTFINTGIAYSGSKALSLDADRFNGGGTADSLKATFNLLPHAATADDIRFDFVYKNHGQGPDNANKIWVRGDDTQLWIEVYDLYANQNEPGTYKKSASIELSDILAANSQDFSTSFQVRFGQFGHLLAADNLTGEGYTFDDIHLYKVDNDIQMVSLDTPIVASCGLNATVPVRVTVRNSADATINTIPVKFSVDGGATVTESIASIAANTSVSYTFTATADLSAIGVHEVKVWVDYGGDSFRENDTITVTIRNSPVIATYPYLENFETNNGNWYSGGKNDSWEYGTPAATRINRAASGSKAWVTNLTGNYRDQQLSYLYSPCFDITGMTSPTLSLSIALDLEDCGAGPANLCDGAYMEYSPDGVSWTRLGAVGQGTNWYNRNYTSNPLWSVQNYTRWHVATIPLPTGYNRLRLRFVVTTDPFVNREGIGVDDIHIYDNTYGIYEGAPYTSNTINQPAVSGSSWVDFTDGGKLIASVNPNGQNLGSTNARTYINTAAVRTNSSQYYHDRNITIKPANRNLADSTSVRFYFLDTETENLINATGCPGCTKPQMAYELGVSKYNDADTSKENGTLADNAELGDWLFIIPSNVIKVPFDKGYYAEFKVKDFSEFWLNNGGLGNNQTLPAELVSFTAKKAMNKKDVLVEWKTASELNVARFEIELAKGNEEFQRNRFVKVGEVSSNGTSSTEQQYSFTDMESGKSGVRYYRLKIVDLDGRFTYSVVRPVVFENETPWLVYPNPSKGLFNFVYQVNEDVNGGVKLYDMNGKLVQQTKLPATGFVQKHSIDLQSPQYAPGLYMLEVTAGEKKQVFRLMKQ
ncbi:MAG: S8 family serine peptidase [Chitinophagaceae bacterium]|nr:S8 family serine peptidase [Chitinophagaceae bacterium]